MRRRAFALALGLLALAGCGRGPNPALRTVTGTVTWKGSPLTQAAVRFIPVGDTRGGGGWGSTDEAGQYTLTDVRGGAGVLPGSYKVVISKRVSAQGAVETKPVGPIDSAARETLPAYYSSQHETTLTAEVIDGPNTLKFALE